MISQLRILWVVILILPLQLFAQNTEISLIPQPSKIQILPGTLNLDQSFNAYMFEEFTDLSTLLSEIPNLTISSFETIKKVRKQHEQGIQIFKAKEYDQIAINGYLLEIDETGILLKAHNKEGMISGILTLTQLNLLANNKGLPFLKINDHPKYPYRGLHLDVSSQYMPIDFIKKYIDIMALYKFNYFHWQLTGSAGWRLEIKKHPELTNNTAWRTHKNWTDWKNNGMQFISKGEPNASGGFYTQNQVKDLILYATRKGITIVPEITIPKQAKEIIAAYPDLACSGTESQATELCLGNEKSYDLLKDILDEVITLFPSKNIHIGGTQADTTILKQCSACLNLMKTDSLASITDLQSYALKQIEDYLSANDRHLVTGEHVLALKAANTTQVMVESNQETIKNAASANYQVIVSERAFLDFTNDQRNPKELQEIKGEYLPLEKVYSYNPMPTELADDKKKNIIGAKANVWSTQASSYEDVAYIVFPRAIALAEVLWSSQEPRNFNHFLKRLQQHYLLLQDNQINYYPPSFSVSSLVTFDSLNKKNTIILSSEQFVPKIRYTLDGVIPDKNSTLYNLPLEFTQTTSINAASFVDSVRVSAVEKIELDVHKAIGKEVTYLTPWDPAFSAQKQFTLTNGIKGGVSIHDSQWQGFKNSLNAVIDFERREEISSIAMNFIQTRRQRVFYPEKLIISVSDNGKNYREIGVVKNQSAKADSSSQNQKFELKLAKPIMARYIQVKAAISDDKFILTDEIIIY